MILSIKSMRLFDVYFNLGFYLDEDEEGRVQTDDCLQRFRLRGHTIQ
jgi:hypothetical protein